MAIARLSVGVGPKGKAGPHAMYIAREGKYAKHNDDLEKLEASGHGNMPDWAATDPNFFWKMSDDRERKNGTSYREHVIALPRELTPKQRYQLVEAWIDQEIGDKHAYQYAIHNPIALDNKEQPHCHLMFSERLIDGIERDPDQYFKRYNAKNPELGGAKKANTPKMSAERKLELKEQRDRWEKLCNQRLELAGSDARISMKSLSEQGIDREPINLSMQQIKTAKIKEIYTNLLSAADDYESAKIDSLSINVANELSSIEINEKYNEQAITAANRASHAINRSQRIVDKINKAIRTTAQANEQLSQQLERGKQRVESSKQLSTVANQAINSSEQAITRRLVQRKTQQQQALERTPFDLVNIRMRSRVINKSYNRVDDDLSGNVPIGAVIIDVINASKAGHSAELNEGNNEHLAKNDTAQAIKAFMLKNIKSHDAIYDYCNLSIKDFTDKHNLKCDLNDLQRLNDIHPSKPVVKPSKQAETNTALNLEQKQQADNSYENSPNF